MEQFWTYGPMFVRELQEHYEEPRPNFNTLSNQVHTLMEDGFLEAVNPKIAVITNKKVEDWKGIKYLKQRQIPYVYTAVYQTIRNTKKPLYLHLVTDGEHWVVERVPGDQVSGVREQ